MRLFQAALLFFILVGCAHTQTQEPNYKFETADECEHAAKLEDLSKMRANIRSRLSHILESAKKAKLDLIIPSQSLAVSEENRKGMADVIVQIDHLTEDVNKALLNITKHGLWSEYSDQAPKDDKQACYFTFTYIKGYQAKLDSLIEKGNSLIVIGGSS